MGKSMAANLLKAGYQLTVFSRTKEKAEQLILNGASWKDSPADVAAVSDTVFLMVGFPADVRETIFGPNGVLEGFARSADTGRTVKPAVVDMTTSSPSLAAEIYRVAAEQKIDALDAPVSGGDIGAKNAALSIMIGGDASTAERLLPLFQVLGKTVVYQGGPGAGQHAKMTNQILIAGNMAGVCEALLYAQRAGLNMESVMKSVASGAAGSWSLSNLGPRILKSDFEPGFFVEHFIKDMTIALEEADRMNLNLPALKLVRELYKKLAESGGARLGTQALIKALAAISDTDFV